MWTKIAVIRKKRKLAQRSRVLRPVVSGQLCLSAPDAVK